MMRASSGVPVRDDVLAWIGGETRLVLLPGQSDTLGRGLAVRKNTRNPFVVVTLRYESDPDKDPETEEGRAWLEREQRDMGCYRVCRECDKPWSVTDHACPECGEATELVLSNRWKREYEIDYQAQSGSYVFDSFSRARNTCRPFRIPSTWRRWRLIDHGYRNPTACYDDQTEVLTENGWRLFRDVRAGDRVATMRADHILEYQHPTARTAYHYTGDLCVVENAFGGLNFAVTPDHRMVYNPRAYAKRYTVRRTGEVKRLAPENRITFAPCDGLPTQAHIPTAPLPAAARDGDAMFVLPPARQDGRGKRAAQLPEMRRRDFAAFIGWFIAEGTASSSGANNPNSWGANYAIKLAQKKHPDAVRAVLDALGLPYHETLRGDGLFTFQISSLQLWQYLKEHVCGNYKGAKRIPREVMEWGEDSLRALLDALMLGDGHRGVSDSYSTVDPGLADDVQELALRLGIPSHICTSTVARPGRRPIHRVALLRGRHSSLRKSSIERRPYDGKVYCLTVPNGTLVVRRGGRTMVCGNCSWLAVDPDGVGWVYAEHYEAGQSVGYHCRRIHEISADVDHHALGLTAGDLREMELPDWEPTRAFTQTCARTYRTLGDPSMANKTSKEVKTILHRYAEGGVYITRANNATAGLETLNSMFAAGTLNIFDTCENMIREIEGLVWQENSDPSKNKKEREVDRNNHLCYDAETEVLTSRGWLRFADISDQGILVATATADGRLEFQAPTARIVLDHDGELLTYGGRGLGVDFAVTPDHKMVYLPAQRVGRLGYMSAEEIARRPRTKVPTALTPSSNRDGDAPFVLPALCGREAQGVRPKPARRVDVARLLGLVISDGSINRSSGRTGDNYMILVHQKKHVDAVRGCLGSLGWTFSERAGKDGVINFTMYNKPLHLWLAEAWADGKRIPEEVFSWGADSLAALLDGLMTGDGSVCRRYAGAWGRESRSGGDEYHTSDPGLADDVQRLAALLGIASRISMTPAEKMHGWNKKPMYRVALVSRPQSIVYGDRITREHYTGKVYCLTVPNGTLVVRRNGKTMVCGNCDGMKYWANEFAPPSAEPEERSDARDTDGVAEAERAEIRARQDATRHPARRKRGGHDPILNV